jgi:integration host factor subunit beta
MVRSELIEILANENPSLSSADADAILSVFFCAIIDHLAAGGRVELRDFGVFSTRSHDARISRDPRNGDPVPVPLKRHVHFRAGKAVAESLQVITPEARVERKSC